MEERQHHDLAMLWLQAGRLSHDLARECVVGLRDHDALRHAGGARREQHRQPIGGRRQRPVRVLDPAERREIDVVFVDLDDPYVGVAASRYTFARSTEHTPTVGAVRRMCSASSGAFAIGSDGTIQAPNSAQASHSATNDGELVSARCTALPSPTPRSCNACATRPTAESNSA